MELTWNLDELFKSHQECLDAYDKIEERIKKLKEYEGKKLTDKTLLEVLDEFFYCKSVSYKGLVYGSLCYYQNVNDEACVSLKATVEKKNDEVIGALSFVDEMLLKEGITSLIAMIDSNPDLEKYREYINELYRKQKHAIITPEITEAKKSINRLINEYNAVIKTITYEPITIDGQEVELTASTIGKYLISQDGETRKQAFFSLNHGYAKVEDKLVELINALCQKRVELAHLLGYDSVLDMALDEEAIDAKIVHELIKVVNAKKPLLHHYMKKKGEILKLENPHLFDLGIPLDNGPRRKYPLEDSIDLLGNIFAPLGEEYTNVALGLIKNNHIDATPNEDKHPTITFSWYGYSFLNYHNAYGDLKNLVHELGHSINDMLSQSLPFPYRISSVFIGETASIVNEILLNRHLIENATSDEELRFYVSKEIDNYITSIYRPTMYTEFELALYQKVEKGEPLTKEYLESTYENLLKSYYGDSMIYDPEVRLEWMRLGHQIRWTFYSYKYATGLLIAATVYENLQNGSLSKEEYMKFLSSGSKEDSMRLLKLLHIDIGDLNILQNGFAILESDIQRVDELSKKIKRKEEPSITI